MKIYKFIVKVFLISVAIIVLAVVLNGLNHNNGKPYQSVKWHGESRLNNNE